MRVFAAVLGFYAFMSMIILLLGWRLATVRRRIAELEVVMEAERIAREVAK